MTGEVKNFKGVTHMFKLTYRMVGFPGLEVADGVWTMSVAFRRAQVLAETGEVIETTIAPADPEDEPGYHASVSAAVERAVS